MASNHRSYTQLTQEERYQIYALTCLRVARKQVKAGHNQSEIAAVLGRNKSTISRELRRNRGLQGYRPKQAQRFADKAEFYFAHPYASWERGLNENTNGLIRQYFPKDRDFSTLSDQEIQAVMDRLNNRPRKCLGMKTPNQVFFGINPPVAALAS